ncbi:hypothetical protein GCM10027592_53480 [Spirosoma flavus]
MTSAKLTKRNENPLLSSLTLWGVSGVAPNPPNLSKAELSGRLVCRPEPPNEPKKLALSSRDPCRTRADHYVIALTLHPTTMRVDGVLHKLHKQT